MDGRVIGYGLSGPIGALEVEGDFDIVRRDVTDAGLGNLFGRELVG